MEFFYKKQLRASLAAFNPYLKEDIRNLRIKLGIPEGGFNTSKEANDWYSEHYERIKGEPFKPRNPWNWHLPKELFEILDSFLYSNKPSRVNYDPEVPLDRYTMDLIHKFGLPEEMVDNLRSYILMEKHNYPSIPSSLQPIFIPINEENEGIKYIAIIAGLDEATTKEEWLDVWQDFQLILRLSSRNKAPSKRPTDTILLRNLKWWKWVRQEKRKTVKEIADEWAENKAIQDNAVTKAVGQIDDLMKPLSD